jgi:hypothetical protein
VRTLFCTLNWMSSFLTPGSSNVAVTRFLSVFSCRSSLSNVDVGYSELRYRSDRRTWVWMDLMGVQWYRDKRDDEMRVP